MKIAHDGNRVIAYHKGFDDISEMYPTLTIMSVPDGTELEKGEGEDLLIPTVNDDAAWEAIRADRDAILAKSDWTQIGDSPLEAGSKQDWQTYRQALRDITDDFATPDVVVWPTKP